jgi:hypothetical protein
VVVRFVLDDDRDLIEGPVERWRDRRQHLLHDPFEEVVRRVYGQTAGAQGSGRAAGPGAATAL